MNFDYKNRVSNIKYFQVENNNLAIFRNDNHLIINNIDLGKSNGHFFFYTDKFYYSEQDKESCTMILSLPTKETICVEHILTKNCLENNTFLQSFDLQKAEKRYYSSKISVMQFNPAIKLYDLPNRYIYSKCFRVENSLFMERYKRYFSSVSLLTGEYEWEVDLGEHGEIRHILGVVENELYVWLGSTTLVAINIQNGFVQWYINTYETHQVGFDTGIHLLADERKIVLFHETNYVEVDLQTQTSKLLLKNTFGRDWEFSANTVVGNYIYFVGRNYATDELSVGAFSRTSLQVEWYYAAPEWQGTVPDDYEGEAVVLGNAPQVTEDKLYVLENGTGTLYIFEKEET